MKRQEQKQRRITRRRIYHVTMRQEKCYIGQVVLELKRRKRSDDRGFTNSKPSRIEEVI